MNETNENKKICNKEESLFNDPPLQNVLTEMGQLNQKSNDLENTNNEVEDNATSSEEFFKNLENILGEGIDEIVLKQENKQKVDKNMGEDIDDHLPKQPYEPNTAECIGRVLAGPLIKKEIEPTLPENIEMSISETAKITQITPSEVPESLQMISETPENQKNITESSENIEIISEKHKNTEEILKTPELKPTELEFQENFTSCGVSPEDLEKISESSFSSMESLRDQIQDSMENDLFSEISDSDNLLSASEIDSGDTIESDSSVKYVASRNSDQRRDQSKSPSNVSIAIDISTDEEDVKSSQKERYSSIKGKRTSNKDESSDLEESVILIQPQITLIVIDSDSDADVSKGTIKPNKMGKQNNTQSATEISKTKEMVKLNKSEQEKPANKKKRKISRIRKEQQRRREEANKKSAELNTQLSTISQHIPITSPKETLQVAISQVIDSHLEQIRSSNHQPIYQNTTTKKKRQRKSKPANLKTPETLGSEYLSIEDSSDANKESTEIQSSEFPKEVTENKFQNTRRGNQPRKCNPENLKTPEVQLNDFFAICGKISSESKVEPVKIPDQTENIESVKTLHTQDISSSIYEVSKQRLPSTHETRWNRTTPSSELIQKSLLGFPPSKAISSFTSEVPRQRSRSPLKTSWERQTSSQDAIKKTATGQYIIEQALSTFGRPSTSSEFPNSSTFLTEDPHALRYESPLLGGRWSSKSPPTSFSKYEQLIEEREKEIRAIRLERELLQLKKEKALALMKKEKEEYLVERESRKLRESLRSNRETFSNEIVDEDIVRDIANLAPRSSRDRELLHVSRERKLLEISNERELIKRKRDLLECNSGKQSSRFKLSETQERSNIFKNQEWNKRTSEKDLEEYRPEVYMERISFDKSPDLEDELLSRYSDPYYSPEKKYKEASKKAEELRTSAQLMSEFQSYHRPKEKTSYAEREYRRTKQRTPTPPPPSMFKPVQKLPEVDFRGSSLQHTQTSRTASEDSYKASSAYKSKTKDLSPVNKWSTYTENKTNRRMTIRQGLGEPNIEIIDWDDINKSNSTSSSLDPPKAKKSTYFSITFPDDGRVITAIDPDNQQCVLVESREERPLIPSHYLHIVDTLSVMHSTTFNFHCFKDEYVFINTTQPGGKWILDNIEKIRILNVPHLKAEAIIGELPKGNEGEINVKVCSYLINQPLKTPHVQIILAKLQKVLRNNRRFDSILLYENISFYKKYLYIYCGHDATAADTLVEILSNLRFCSESCPRLKAHKDGDYNNDL